ncbi:CRISPR-associated endoribonuclease Cas6 [Roseofilum casamattae]|uniref:CRISPR-associated endoribonuclease Cas6 n=1 Tax=Roseofilum casamattae BLCC-M143 TaxID=3022442 RepID=A0ABT7BS67_9CYAN|nr:CRISPR-associated endoribonuclease Cas6 [Roseofilum casamattae]MDJ1182034.1 CRISPR-associated endoribonuclease Cas6 [Roseofilum casamattae BLCC-M143]
MPYSLVLNLTPLAPIPVGYLSGRHLHALFLNLVSSVDRNLGDRLHHSHSDKAFTLSPLQNYHPGKPLRYEHQYPIPAATPCWWRISLLDDALFSKLTQLWLNLNPNKPWHLGPADLNITSILATPQSTHPWANSSSYRQLYDEASDRDRAFRFRLATPTAFRQGEYDTALPNGDRIFASLRQRWNKYSNIEIPRLDLDTLFPSFFNIQTAMVADKQSKFIGSIGEIAFRLLGDSNPTTIKHLNLLANYALYSGIGRKTPMGMGMARRISRDL